jgi:uncharacterized protein with GYD domain
MATFAILASLTEAGARDLQGIMERRSESLRDLERHGIKTLADYALMGGEYDFLYLVEAESSEAILQQIAKATEKGRLKFRTMPALPLDEFARLVR